MTLCSVDSALSAIYCAIYYPNCSFCKLRYLRSKRVSESIMAKRASGDIVFDPVKRRYVRRVK